MTQTGTITNATATIGLAVIATQVDIYLVIFLLIFFSLVHGVIMYQYAKNRIELNFDYVDFLSFVIVAISAGILFALMGLIAGIGEYYIYMCTAIGSISGKRGFEVIFRWITKKMTGKEIYLFDKD